jgi:hypothetical protein
MWATVRAWVGSAKAGRCKYCHRPIIWVITDRGRYLPFDLGFTVREIVTRPADGARFTVLDKDDRHACPERKKRQNANTGSQTGEDGHRWQA